MKCIHSLQCKGLPKINCKEALLGQKLRTDRLTEIVVTTTDWFLVALCFKHISGIILTENGEQLNEILFYSFPPFYYRPCKWFLLFSFLLECFHLESWLWLLWWVRSVERQKFCWSANTNLDHRQTDSINNVIYYPK